MTEEWITDSWKDGSDYSLNTEGVGEDIKSEFGNVDSVDRALTRAVRDGPGGGYRRQGFYATDRRDGATVSTDSSEGPQGKMWTMSELFNQVQYLKFGDGTGE